MVFVIDKSGKPLAPCTNARARILLTANKAVVVKRYPFVIRLKEKKTSTKEFTIKIDPGSKTTGVAIVNETSALFFFELIHRGKEVKKALMQRRGIRRSRRNRKTRYRKARFLNRARPQGWIAPSVKSRADNVINFVRKYKKYINLTKAVIERVSFDTHEMTANSKLYGTQYQQGELYHTNVRKYILGKFNNCCAYCGATGKLELDHIVPRSKGGTNSVKNLVLSCRSCNEAKGSLSLKEFGKLIKKDLSHLEPYATPKDAAIVQSAREYMIKEVNKIVSVDTFDSWLTSLNRHEANLPKEHYYDAMCVGDKFDYQIKTNTVLIVKATGRGTRQMCRVDRFGFPRASAKTSKVVNGFMTGDIVKAIVTQGKKIGNYIGRVAVRKSGNFNINTKSGTVQGISFKYCKLIQKGDGYEYISKKCA